MKLGLAVFWHENGNIKGKRVTRSFFYFDSGFNDLFLLLPEIFVESTVVKELKP